MTTKYDVEQEPIVLSKALLDLFLKQKNPGDLIALYTFYYYTAKWQKTNRVRATVEYTAKGLGWGIDKTRARRNQLKSLGLIEDYQIKAEGKLGKRYVKVNFIWCKDTVLGKNRTTETPYYGKTGTNALSNSKGNALSNSKGNAARGLGLKPEKYKHNLPKHLAIENLPKEYQENTQFVTSWLEWIDYRKKEKKTPIGSIGATKQFNTLREMEPEQAIEAINIAMASGWKSFFPQKDLPSKELRNAYRDKKKGPIDPRDEPDLSFEV